MNCEIIKDLIPLYVDGCCSKESEKAVEEHLRNCPECKKLSEEMQEPTDIIVTSQAPKEFNKINTWKAAVMQSVLLFVAFGLITFGVALEASTDYDNMFNGLIALNLVVPATGFMLSLANWYFVRIYKSRRSFATTSSLITLGITTSAYIWTLHHYEVNSRDLFAGATFADTLHGILFLCGTGIFLTMTFCILSGILSNKYAAMTGKD